VGWNARTGQDQGHPDTPFVEAVFAEAAAVAEHLAMVGGKNDDGILGLPRLLQPAQHPSELGVDVGAEGVVAEGGPPALQGSRFAQPFFPVHPLGAGVPSEVRPIGRLGTGRDLVKVIQFFVARRHVEGCVRKVEGEVKEEGFPFFPSATQKLERLLGQPRLGVLLGRHRARKAFVGLDGLPSPIGLRLGGEGGVRFGALVTHLRRPRLHPSRLVGVPLGPDLEAPGRGLYVDFRREPFAEIPVSLTESRRLVTRLVQALGEHGHRQILVSRAHLGVVAHPHLRRVQARHQRIAAGHAHGSVDGGPCEADAAGGQGIKVGRLDQGIYAAEGVPAILVRHQKQDVWSSRSPSVGAARQLQEVDPRKQTSARLQ
jgi:hypothetical protein